MAIRLYSEHTYSTAFRFQTTGYQGNSGIQIVQCTSSDNRVTRQQCNSERIPTTGLDSRRSRPVVVVRPGQGSPLYLAEPAMGQLELVLLSADQVRYLCLLRGTRSRWSHRITHSRCMVINNRPYTCIYIYI